MTDQLFLNVRWPGELSALQTHVPLQALLTFNQYVIAVVDINNCFLTIATIPSQHIH